jgi:hypothetical protein
MKVSILKKIPDALRGKMLLLVSLVFLVAFSFTIHLFAAPPTTQYVPGQTLDPNCTPGSSNCTVAVEPAATTFDTVVSSSYTIDASGHTDQTIYADTSSGDITITLPSLSSAPTMRRTIHIIKISAANTLYVNGASGDFINFTTSIEVNTARQTITFQSLGQNQWSAVPNFDALSISPILVKAATAVALGAHTYSNGVSGIGATLTGSGALPAINGISISIGERILVKNEGTCTATQCDSIENGVYSLTSNSPWVLTRTTDSDSTSEFYPQIVIPTQGTNTIRGKQWIQQAPDPVVGTDTIAYKKTGSGTGGSGGLGDVVQGIGGTQKRGQIAFWTNNTKELSQGTSKLFWDNTNKRFGVGTNTPSATFQVNGSSDNSAASPLFGVISTALPLASSTSGGNILFSGQGGSNSGSSIAGNGGDFNVLLGAGGIGTGQDGGNGGEVNFLTGNGGASDLVAGDGGRLQLATGLGASSSGGAGGNGGIFILTTGDGGAGAGGIGATDGNGGNLVITTGDSTLGEGGDFQIATGAGGGKGGDFSILTGGGNGGGNMNFTTGIGGPINNGLVTGVNDGGLISFETGAGASSVSSPGGFGGDFSITTGNGAGATGLGAGPHGGNVLITAGNGGQNLSPFPGTSQGGNLIFTSGNGGNGASRDGSGGDVTFTTGDAANNAADGTANGGAFTITTGSSPGGNHGGDITLNPGTGAIRNGNVLLANTAGNVGIGNVTPVYQLHVKGDDGSGNVAKFESNAGTACTLNGTTGLINCTSDRTLKKDIVDLGSELSNILALKPVSYRWNTDDGSAEKKFGFIAQDVESIFPSLVLTDAETGKKSLSIGGMVPFMVKAIQELNAKVDALGGGAVAAVADVGAFLSTTAEKFVNGVTHVAHLIVGSPENRIGITIYDEATGEPYCIKVVNGQMQNIAGACETPASTSPPVSTDSDDPPPQEDPAEDPPPVSPPSPLPDAEL